MEKILKEKKFEKIASGVYVNRTLRIDIQDDAAYFLNNGKSENFKSNNKSEKELWIINKIKNI